MRNWSRDDPVADMEDSQEDKRPILGYCQICGMPIHGGTAIYGPDDAYEIDGDYICYDHLHDYFEDNKLK